MRAIGKTISRLAITGLMFLLYGLAQSAIVAPTMLGQSSPALSAFVFAAAFGGLIYLLWTMYTRFLKQDHLRSDYGLYPFRPRGWRILVIAIAVLIVLQVASSLLVSTHTIPQAQNQDQLMQMMHRSPLPMILMSVVGGPPVEELIFRGLLIHSFPHQDKKSWRIFAAVVSALCFGLAHTGFSDLRNLFIYAGMGLVFGWVYEQTGDMRYNIFLHFLNNFLALFF